MSHDQQQITPLSNPTWIQTTHGGPNTNVEQSYHEVIDRLMQAYLRDDPVVEFTVQSKRANDQVGRYRRLFIIAHIVQVGNTKAEVSDQPDNIDESSSKKRTT